MKILVLSNYYPPHFVGGYEIACFHTVNFLREQGHEVQVLTGNYLAEPRPKHAFKEEHVHRQMRFIDYVHGNVFQKHQTERHNYELAKKTLAAFQPDLVYIWSLRSVSLGALYAVQDSGLPSVYEMGDFWLDSYLKPGLKAHCKRQLKSYLPFTLGGKIKIKHAISVSQWMAQELKQKYAIEHCQVIPNGTPVNPPVPRKTFQDQTRLLFVGRIDPEKGLHLAIEALAQVKAKHPQQKIIFTIAGSGDISYTRLCQDKVHQLGLKNCVKFLGAVPDPGHLYETHDILLMPTLMREPFGLVIIEAMMRGMTVIASNAYGPAEIIQDGYTGLLCQPNVVEALAADLNHLVLDPMLRRRLGQNAYAHAKEMYSLKKLKKQVEAYLIDVAQQTQKMELSA